MPAQSSLVWSKVAGAGESGGIFLARQGDERLVVFGERLAAILFLLLYSW